LLLFLFFVSGFLSLVYQVLWVRELGLLFGNSTYAIATTLAVFFLGLSAGSYFWGRGAASLRAPVKAYAGLELGIALSALLYFLLIDFYHFIYSPIFAAFGDSRLVLITVKFLLAAVVLFPPSFFMGGTVPVMAQCLIRRTDELGKTGSLLYAVNTLGAALGAFVAGFYLPIVFGFQNTYLMAIAGNLVIACGAYLLTRDGTRFTVAHETDVSPTRYEVEIPSKVQLIGLLAFASGFAALALEVLWTRMFSQVLHNSVYSFSAILTTFLIALALGSAFAHLLCRLNVSPHVGVCPPALPVECQSPWCTECAAQPCRAPGGFVSFPVLPLDRRIEISGRRSGMGRLHPGHLWKRWDRYPGSRRYCGKRFPFPTESSATVGSKPRTNHR
jgi:spermidine synthase